MCLVTGETTEPAIDSSPVTNHQLLVTHQYPLGRASESMKLPLRGESFHT